MGELICVVGLEPHAIGNPAGRALIHEGLDYWDVRLDTSEPRNYGRWLSQRFNEKQEFVIIEHDVVPYPGAVAHLLMCEEHWCVHEYPFRDGILNWGLGCTKFSGQLLKGCKPLVNKLPKLMWWDVEGEIRTYLTRTLELEPHVHTPAVAHAPSHDFYQRGPRHV